MTCPHPLTPARPSARGRTVLTRAAVALGALSLGFALAGCTASPSGGSSPAASSASASAVTTPGATTTPGSSPTGTPTASPAPTITLDITLAHGQVTPNGQKLDAKVGDTVALSVTSDAADEIHAHTGGAGYELPVRARQTTTGSFTITQPGSIEVESHELGKTIVILNAR